MPGRTVVWYQSDRIADLDCQVANVEVYDANITGATSAKASVVVVNAVGRPIHRNSTVCQGGTTRVATGQDRRLGDFLTNSLDERGCVMIGTGEPRCRIRSPAHPGPSASRSSSTRLRDQPHHRQTLRP